MIRIMKITNNQVTISWEINPDADHYEIYWSDRELEPERYRLLETVPAECTTYTLEKSTHVPHYLAVRPVMAGKTAGPCTTLRTPVHYIRNEQTESLGRGLVAVKTDQGVFLSWRMFVSEVCGFSEEAGGMTGVNYRIYRNGRAISLVTNSTNYADVHGTCGDVYAVAPVQDGEEGAACEPVAVWEREYLDIPVQKPEDGVTPQGERYTYSANDMSVSDVDGDGEYEYLVKWDPSNSHDVSIKGYTGRCYIDCYKLDGRLLWRLDMGANIRAGAHYTQFICYDFNGDGRGEMAVKTAPGTKMTVYGRDGTPAREFYITMPEEDIRRGYGHEDSYVCSADDYYEHLTELFLGWRELPEVVNGQWPDTLEACFGIQKRCEYPLKKEDARALADYFLDVYAPERSTRNDLRRFEGFIYEGPEYLTMFGGDGEELETVPFPFPREDDGLRWGDYAMNRIEPCNRVDRFLSGAAYLDGIRPYLIVCRGYYTRSCLAAYDFFEGKFREKWKVDSGYVPMRNPFNDVPHALAGSDPVYGKLAGQGNHSISTADVDGDGCMEIIYGAACIDHDGSLLYSSYDRRPDGVLAKMGHGDAMHVADMDPDRPGLEIFNVFEGAEYVPYGYALRDAATGEAIFGTYAEEDLGRCMIGDMVPGVRGYQCWVNGAGIYDCRGRLLDTNTPGTNMSIRWSGDLTTQITDGSDFDLNQKPTGVIQDLIHGVMLTPENTLTNNGTKGNPCLTADIFGDFREELLLRTADSSSIRIYTNTEVTDHKLFTLMQDTQYRCSVAWQNNCYNQPGYPSFYYGSDMEFGRVLPYMKHKPVLYLAGDSTAQSYGSGDRPQAGWGEMLLSCLDPDTAVKTGHREDCPFEQEMQYETRHLIVDNCAAAGRSSKTFLEEGRLEDIKKHLKEGDTLLIQFGHNDAAASKAERFVPAEQFGGVLEAYVRAAKECNAVPVLLSSICLYPCSENEEGEKGAIAASLPRYAEEMRKLAEREHIPYIDLGMVTGNWLKGLSETEAAGYYREDKVHLTAEGARRFAGLASEELKKLRVHENAVKQA
ncbi:rhamnogalacturonan lyase family protein [Hungatella hathewayi]|uniref:rhamnogalacturonan lyase family protein n=1 Tax=Hungatella hathewayi TaxID=154046 RepID=UPI0035668FFE